jgi:hypothetical protein
MQLPLIGTIDKLLQLPHGLVLIVRIGNLACPAEGVQHARRQQPADVDARGLGQVWAEVARLAEADQHKGLVEVGRVRPAAAEVVLERAGVDACHVGGPGGRAAQVVRVQVQVGGGTL